MAMINLLPWRDEYRQEKKREFFSVLALCLILAVVIIYVWLSFVQVSIDSQQARNDLLEKEIALLDAKVREIEILKTKREELEGKTEVIQGLQSRRPLIVRYFDGLVKVLPDGVYFSKVGFKDNIYTISGIAESNGRISTLMRSFDQHEYFTTPNLKNVVQNKFDLTVEVTVPDEPVNSEQR